MRFQRLNDKPLRERTFDLAVLRKVVKIQGLLKPFQESSSEPKSEKELQSLCVKILRE